MAGAARHKTEKENQRIRERLLRGDSVRQIAGSMNGINESKVKRIKKALVAEGKLQSSRKGS